MGTFILTLGNHGRRKSFVDKGIFICLTRASLSTIPYSHHLPPHGRCYGTAFCPVAALAGLGIRTELAPKEAWPRHPQIVSLLMTACFPSTAWQNRQTGVRLPVSPDRAWHLPPQSPVKVLAPGPMATHMAREHPSSPTALQRAILSRQLLRLVKTPRAPHGLAEPTDRSAPARSA